MTFGLVQVVRADSDCVCFDDRTFTEVFIRNRKRSDVLLHFYTSSTPKKILENSEWEAQHVHCLREAVSLSALLFLRNIMVPTHTPLFLFQPCDDISLYSSLALYVKRASAPKKRAASFPAALTNGGFAMKGCGFCSHHQWEFLKNSINIDGSST